MKFKTLTLHNFQCHKKLVISFDRHITTLQGATDVGKSAILRALRWCCLNDLSGSDFIREGSDEVRVVLQVRHQKQDYLITRTKGNRTNLYELGEKEFKSFNSNVPEDISRLLSLGELNFQNQHDSPFWFNETAGEVSRRLNAVVDLSIIDDVLAAAARELREAESLVNASEQRLGQFKEEMEQLDPQRQRVKEYAILQQKKKQHEETQENFNRLESLFRDFGKHQTKQKETQQLIQVLGDLRHKTHEHLQAQRKSKALKEILGRAEKLNQITAPPSFREIESAFERFQYFTQTEQALKELLIDIQTMQQKIKSAQVRSTKATAAFHEAIKNEHCPLCQNPL